MVCAGRISKIREIKERRWAIKFYRIKYQQSSYYAVWEHDHYQVINGTPFDDWQPSGLSLTEKDTELLPPVEPSKIIAVGLNYRSHARELKMTLPDEPLIFLKPITALAGPNDKINLPRMSQRIDYEGELAIVIKKKCKAISQNEVNGVIAGYTLANDITARDLQEKDGQWTRAKGFDGFCPVGPCLAIGLSAADLEFKTYLNDELKQTGHSDDFIFNIPTIVSFVSEIMTLMPGDIILTGTPPGIGPVKSGDIVKVQCDQIGELINCFD